jgi:hypothetical protein
MKADLRLGRWEDALADVPDASVRLILTSPPYDNARTYEGVGGVAVDFDALAIWAIRILVPGGTLAMVIDGAVNDHATSTTPFRVLCRWAERHEWVFSQMLAYARNGTPGEYRGRFRRDHEPLLVFQRRGGVVVCNKDALAEQAKYAEATGTATERDGTKRRGGYSERATFRDIRHRGSVWSYGSVGNGHDPSSSTGHPATFAEAFARDAIRVWSNPGDIVCDPFSGSGTVGRACIDLNRAFVGAEMVAKYHRKALRRLAQTALPTEAA